MMRGVALWPVEGQTGGPPVYSISMTRPLLLLIVLVLAASSNFLRADAPPSPEARLAAAQQLADGFHYQQGEITLRGGLAKIKLSPAFRYLDPRDAETLLTKIWNNPASGAQTLGMLVPADVPLTSSDAWATVITYDEDGYVKDDDAGKINYTDLLQKMQKDVREGSKEREKNGFAAIELVGWAAPPRYDAAAHKLYWAKELRFGDSSEDTLNYNIRMLGRRGVLVLNVVAGMNQFDEVQRAAPSILAMVDFQEGHRYVDFKPGTDKVATYGLAALVAGGVLAKVGFFKVLLAGLLAAKKLVIVAFAAFAAGIKKLFAKLTGRRQSSDGPI